MTCHVASDPGERIGLSKSKLTLSEELAQLQSFCLHFMDKQENVASGIPLTIVSVPPTLLLARANL